MSIRTYLFGLFLVLLMGGGNPAFAQDNMPASRSNTCVPHSLTTVIPMVPSITQVLIDLGLDDRIIAMDTQSAILHRPGPDVPVFDMLSPDIEQLAALRPSLLLVSSISMIGDNDPFLPLKKLGLCVAYVRTSDSLDGIKEDLRFIATVVGRPDKGTEIVADMEQQLQEMARSRPPMNPPLKVYFEIAPAPAMYSFGQGVFLNEMIELAGAQNIFADRNGWVRVEAESIVAANPDVIFTNVSYLDDPVAEIAARPGWSNIKAVRNKRVYAIDNSATSLPNHHIVEGIAAMMKALYPNE